MKIRLNKPLKPRRLRRVLKIGLISLAVLGGLTWVGVERWYRLNLRPPNIHASEILFTIEPGSPTIDIANQLKEAGVIRNATAFIWYLGRQPGGPTLQAGSYRLNTSLSVAEVADILTNGRVDTSLVTISPGLRLDQIENQLIEAGFERAEVSEALKAQYDHPLLQYKPPTADLEGYIFPETLQITHDSTVESIIERSLGVFYEKLTPSLLAGLEDQGLSVHQAIILASIVQEEVSAYEDQRKVAQVFLRRLAEELPLGADPTFRYAAIKSGKPETPDIDSPYNTRLHTGLPPGPIANFAINALRAVAEPADTDYLYFVSGDDGTTHFAHTLAEHEANVERYCIDLCKL